MSGVMATAVPSAIRYTVGTTPQTDFVVPFVFDEATDLQVTVDGVAITAFTLVSTIVAEGFYTAATVRLDVAAASTDVVLSRQTAVEQSVKFATSGTFPVSALNTEIIRLWLAQQDRQRDTENALRMAPGEAAAAEFPTRALRAGKWMAFDGAGDPTVAEGSADGLPATSFGASLANAADAAAARALLDVYATAVAARLVDALLRTGGTLTGDLTVAKVDPGILLDSTGVSGRNIWGRTGTSARWQFVLGNNSPESGGNAGSDIALASYTDLGVALSVPFFVQRATGYLGLGGVTNPGSQLDMSGSFRLRGATSGYIALKAPAVAPSGEWTWASADGAANQAMVTNGAGVLSFSDRPAAVNTAKAWCRFDGTTAGTNPPTSGFNVTSIQRTGTGTYTVNLTNALADANYAVIGIARGSGGAQQMLISLPSGGTKTTTAVQINCMLANIGQSDSAEIMLLFFGA